MGRIFKTTALMGLTLVLGALSSSPVKAADPVRGGGPFGLGVEVGYPGNWGVVGNLWIDYVNSLQPAVKFDGGGNAILQLDYLWHNYHILRPQSGALPFYIGLGGDLTLVNPASIGIRVPIGLSYIFGRHTPLDIYAQIVPTLWLSTNHSEFDCYGEVGARIYP
jgi:hypothetical protein